MREIHLTPIPAAEHEQHGGGDTVDLHCSICDLRMHAEGSNLDGFAEVVDQAHQQRHQREGGGA